MKTTKMTYDNRFMCVCSPDELKECQEVLAEVTKLFDRGHKVDILDRDGYNLTAAHADAGLISDAVYWANWGVDNHVYEWGFAADQWAMAICTEYAWDEEKSRYSEEPSDVVSFQCDVVEHGIAACIKYYTDKHGER